MKSRRRLMLSDIANRITGTASHEFTTELGGETYTFSAPSFNVKYTGGTLTSLNDVLASSSGLLTIDDWTIDTSHVTNMFQFMRDNRTVQSVNLSKLDTSNVTNMSWVLGTGTGSSKLTKIDISTWDTSHVINMNYMLRNARFVTCDLSNFNTHSLVNCGGMLRECPNLETVIFGKDFTFENVTNISEFLLDCTKLTEIRGGLKGLKKSISLSGSPITHDNAVEIMESLGTPAGDAQTITFAAGTYETLTEEEKKIATAKNWAVASA